MTSALIVLMDFDVFEVLSINLPCPFMCFFQILWFQKFL